MSCHSDLKKLLLHLSPGQTKLLDQVHQDKTTIVSPVRVDDNPKVNRDDQCEDHMGQSHT